jgi:D-glycero-D-manno-heptose 1,7-bisphosphate phosphatase
MSIPKYIICDRDGTLIKHIHYLCDPNLVELLPYVKETLFFLKSKGCKFFLHTNQRGVGKGLFKIEDAISCNNRLLSLLEFGNDFFDKICIATDLNCDSNNYRKPSALFANEIILKYKCSKSDLLYIGDSISDMETALKVGCTGFGLISEKSDLYNISKKKSLIRLFNNWQEIKYHLIKIN